MRKIGPDKVFPAEKLATAIAMGVIGHWLMEITGRSDSFGVARDCSFILHLLDNRESQDACQPEDEKGLDEPREAACD